MSTQTTEIAPDTIAQKMPVYEALCVLSYAFGDLPTPYVVVHSTASAAFVLQLDSPHAFELWRQALEIAPSAVLLKPGTDSVWLEAEGSFRDLAVSLCCFGVPLSLEAAKFGQAIPAAAEVLA